VERQKLVTQKFNVEKLKENINIQNYMKTINRHLEDNGHTELDQLWEKLEKIKQQ